MWYLTEITRCETNSFGDQIFEVVFWDCRTDEQVGSHYLMNPEGCHQDLSSMLAEAKDTFENQNTLPIGQANKPLNKGDNQ